MKIVIEKEGNPPTVELSKLNPSSKVYALMVPSGQLSILHKLGYGYGSQYSEDWALYHYAFINISKSSSRPTYRARTARETIQKAINRGNTVMEFETLTDLLQWKLKHTTHGSQKA